MYYLDYAKKVGDRWILNFFADTIEDLKDVPTTTPYVTRNGTNYGIPLDTSVVTIVEDGVRVNYVLQEGKYIVGGDIPPVVGTKTITENGTYAAKTDNLEGYSSVTVDVEPNLQEKSQIPNANPVAVEPDEGYYGLSKVTVEAIPSDYIIPNGTKTITTNGETDVKTFAKVDVNVEPKLQTKTQTPGTVSVAVKPDAGYYGLSQVTVSAVPVETKSATPTKSAQTITPTSGKFLSEVSVAAIPDEYIVPAGSKDISTNGQYDVKQIANVNVNVNAYTGDKWIVKYAVDNNVDIAGAQIVDMGEQYMSMDSIRYLSFPDVSESIGLSYNMFDNSLKPEIVSIPIPLTYSFLNIRNNPLKSAKICYLYGDAENPIDAHVYLPSGANLDFLSVKNAKSLSGDVYANKVVVVENVDRFPYGTGAHANCVYLKNVKRIDKQVYKNDTNLFHIELSDNLTFIGDECFYGDVNLYDIVLPDTLVNIGFDAFEGTGIVNKSSGTIYLPSMSGNEHFALIRDDDKTIADLSAYQDVKIFAGGTFNGLDNLIDLTIPDGVVSICNGCFESCKNLKTVTIPSSVGWIGAETNKLAAAFANCPSLTTVYINGDLSKSEKPKGIFKDCPSLTEIHYDGQVFTTADEFLEYGWPSGGGSGSGNYGS